MIRDCDELVKTVCKGIRERVDVAVVGLSGGADSALTAMLSMKALGKDNVYGLSMPYNETDVRTFNALSAQVAEQLGIHHFVRPISAIADAIVDQIGKNGPEDVTPVNAGNARSRARMCVLYGFAHTLSAQLPGKRVRVMGTGNLSEDFIGYDTKGGDALADIFPIGELFKSEVYQLLEHFVTDGTFVQHLVNRTPSAGLEDDQTDEADLGYSYNAMEDGVRFCIEHYESMPEELPDEITAFVWNRHMAHKHKHEAPVVIPLRNLCD